MIAGGSTAAARRASRHGLGFIAYTDAPGLKEAFGRPSRSPHGYRPGPAQFPDGRSPTAVFVTDDADAAWNEIGSPCCTTPGWPRGTARATSRWRASPAPKQSTRMRSVPGPYAILTVDEAVDRAIRGGASLPLHPLCGGMPPELAWPYLERAALAVSAARGGAV